MSADNEEFRPLDEPYRIDRWQSYSPSQLDIEVSSEMTRYHVIVTWRETALGTKMWTFTVENQGAVYGEFADLQDLVDIVPTVHTTFLPGYLSGLGARYTNPRTATLIAYLIDDVIRWWRMARATVDTKQYQNLLHNPAVIVWGEYAP